MPIKGISEVRRMRRIGKVRLGEKKTNAAGKEYPTALDHFNFVDAPELLAMYGKDCKEIDIIIPNENVDAFFPQERKCYRTSGLFCRGDGETATRVNVGLSDGDKNAKAVPKGQPLDPEGMEFIKAQGLNIVAGDMFDMPCLGEKCHFTERKFCKPIGRFLFMVPKTPRIGIYEISTTSYNSIVELNSAIDTIRAIAGRISMIPLKLRLVPKETKVPKTAMKKTIFHLVMEYHGSIESLSKFRDAKQIPMEQLPARHELEQHIPNDLMPMGGEKLDDHLAGKDNIADPTEAEIVPPTAGNDTFTISGSFLFGTGGKVEMRGPKPDQKYRIDPATAKTAKANFKDGDTAEVAWEIKDGVKWVTDLDRKAATSDASETF